MEEILHTFSGILHILTAVTWIGSMIYSQFAVNPALKPLGDMKSHAVNGMVMKKFNPITWTSLIILVLTGTYAVFNNMEKLIPFFTEPSGIVLFIKLVLAALLIVILFLQVFVYGPKMGSLISPSTPKNQENQMGMTRTANSAKVLSSILSIRVLSS